MGSLSEDASPCKKHYQREEAALRCWVDQAVQLTNRCLWRFVARSRPARALHPDARGPGRQRRPLPRLLAGHGSGAARQRARLGPRPEARRGAWAAPQRSAAPAGYLAAGAAWDKRGRVGADSSVLCTVCMLCR